MSLGHAKQHCTVSVHSCLYSTVCVAFMWKFKTFPETFCHLPPFFVKYVYNKISLSLSKNSKHSSSDKIFHIWCPKQPSNNSFFVLIDQAKFIFFQFSFHRSSCLIPTFIPGKKQTYLLAIFCRWQVALLTSILATLDLSRRLRPITQSLCSLFISVNKFN